MKKNDKVRIKALGKTYEGEIVGLSKKAAKVMIKGEAVWVPLGLMETIPAPETPHTPAPTPVSAQEILRTAADTIDARAAERDTENERSMARCVTAYNAITGHALSEADGWLFMTVLKLARSRSGLKSNIDDHIDAAAYCALEGECHA